MKSRALVVLVLLVVVDASFFGQGAAGSRGLRVKCDGVSPAYTLFAPMSSGVTYLVDINGQVVRTWKSTLLPSAWIYFLDNGHVLRGGSDRGLSPMSGGGQGGRFQEFDFDGNLVWDFVYNTPQLPHHDVAVLPNGNILAIAWESKTAEETRAVGRRPSAIPPGGIWPDMLIEFEPQPPNNARIVWEWHLWDHLVQNIEPTLQNYADPASRPERININSDAGGFGFSKDVFHTNAVAYNPELDQIVLSVPTFNEIWVIDHSTTTQDAAGRTGGRSGKGGDLIYRWGNPEAYGRGTAADQLLGFQHNAHWIPQGRPGAGHMTVFSNQTPSPTGEITKVYEFVPPVDADGRYATPVAGPFGPAAPVWTYSDSSLQASSLSGAERLENGHTLISSGPQGRVFEITTEGKIVWDYWSPYAGLLGNSGNAFSLFRATRIPADHPGLAGRDLRPMDPQPPHSPLASIAAAPDTGSCPPPVIPPVVPPLILPRPTLTSITPAMGARGGTLDVTLTGTNFTTGLTLNAGPDVLVGNLQVMSSTDAKAQLRIDAVAALGSLDVGITTDGGASNTVSFAVADPFPDLAISSTHAGNFGVGFDETYDITVRNVGGAPTAGTITVTDLLSAGFTFVSASGWSCSASGALVTCTHSGVLAPNDSSRYQITVAVNGDGSGRVNHSPSVAVDGDLNVANNTASDVTSVVTASPAFAFTPAVLSPGQQATVAITMATPFPHDLTGLIDLTFSSNAVVPVDDPAIQLAIGGRETTFTIPAGETEGRFGPALQRGPLAFQSGTVAGTLAFSGTFTAGKIRGNFAPAPGVDALTIPLRALSIQSVRTSTDGGFAASILLMSAAREVTHLSLSFNTNPRVALSCGTTPGCSVSGNTLTLDVSPLFSRWFNGDEAFGGMAQLRLPLSIEGGAVRGSVAVTLRNTKGESNSQSFTLP